MICRPPRGLGLFCTRKTGFARCARFTQGRGPSRHLGWGGRLYVTAAPRLNAGIIEPVESAEPKADADGRAEGRRQKAGGRELMSGSSARAWRVSL